MTSPGCAKLLREFHSLVAEQRRLCEQGDLDRALALMPARNALFERLETVFDERSVSGDEPPMLQLLQNIIADDSLLLAMLGRQKRRLQQERLRLKQGRKLLSGYATPAS